MLRTFSVKSNPMQLLSEVPLKPARKCLQTFGESFLDETGSGAQIGLDINFSSSKYILKKLL